MDLADLSSQNVQTDNKSSTVKVTVENVAGETVTEIVGEVISQGVGAIVEGVFSGL
jgi:hypothetical protein